MVQTFEYKRVFPEAFGAVGDGVTDCTVAVQAAIDAVMGATGAGAGGIVEFGCGRFLISGSLVIRNDGASSNPRQPYLRLTGQGAGANGRWLSPLSGAATVLDLRYNASVAKIDTRGQGLLEIDHLMLYDGGSDAAAFVFTTNTTLRIHDSTFMGTASGASAVNDGIILGGTSASGFATLASTAPFQGYGTIIKDNFFSQMRRCVVCQSAANNIQLVTNTVSNDCGSATAGDGAFMIMGVGDSARGNYFAGNLIEVTNYQYGIVCAANNHGFYGNGIWDKGVGTLGAYNFAGGGGNIVIGYHESTFGSSVFMNAGASNFLVDTNAGARYSTQPIVRTPQLVPTQDSQTISNGGTASVNNTGAMSHKVIANTGCAALTISSPTVNAGMTGLLCSVIVRNTSGGSLAVTWGASYRLATWGSLADGFQRTINFTYDGSSWIESSRSGDIPN